MSLHTTYIGHAPTPQVAAEQHRGSPELSKEQLERLYPTIHVKGYHAKVRAREIHDFRGNGVTDKDIKDLCNLCGLLRMDPKANHSKGFTWWGDRLDG